MKKETMKQLEKRVDNLIADRQLGHLICRTCGEAGCCVLAHDNTGVKNGDRFEKSGEVYTA